MGSQDFFYLSLGASGMVFVIIIAWIANQVVLTLKTVRSVAERVDDATRGLTLVKAGLKVGAFTLIGKLLGGGGKK